MCVSRTLTRSQILLLDDPFTHLYEPSFPGMSELIVGDFCLIARGCCRVAPGERSTLAQISELLSKITIDEESAYKRSSALRSREGEDAEEEEEEKEKKKETEKGNKKEKRDKKNRKKKEEKTNNGVYI